MGVPALFRRSRLAREAGIDQTFSVIIFEAMNVHHLELFYYVARHGGISEAVRNIPYGIQQPAVSGQVAQLEEDLGVTLFHRRPFSLTPPGQKLYRFIEPFFGGLNDMAQELQGGSARQLRIGIQMAFQLIGALIPHDCAAECSCGQ